MSEIVFPLQVVESTEVHYRVVDATGKVVTRPYFRRQQAEQKVRCATEAAKNKAEDKERNRLWWIKWEAERAARAT